MSLAAPRDFLRRTAACRRHRQKGQTPSLVLPAVRLEKKMLSDGATSVPADASAYGWCGLRVLSMAMTTIRRTVATTRRLTKLDVRHSGSFLLFVPTTSKDE